MIRRSEVIIAIIALVVALFTAIGAYHLLARGSQPKKGEGVPSEQKSPEQKTQKILVANRNLKIGDSLAEGTVWQEWPVDPSRSDLIQYQETISNKLKELVAKRSVAAGEPINESVVLDTKRQSTLSALLKPGLRAVSLNVDPASTSSGLIMPGDNVDVIITYPSDKTGSDPVSRTLLCDVRILALDQRLSGDQDLKKGEGTAVAPRTVTLEVTPKQAESVTMATKAGTASLSLHSANRSKGAQCVENPPVHTDPVKVIRGDQPTVAH